MREYWEENLHALGRQDLIQRLDKISRVFNGISLQEKYNEDQLYFIVDQDFKEIKIGLSKRPLDNLRSLQDNSPKKIVLLYYFDPMEQQRRFKESLPDVKLHPEYQSAMDARNHQIEWLNHGQGNNSVGGWNYLDNRALGILIKKGMIYLKELMTDLGLDYREA